MQLAGRHQIPGKISSTGQPTNTSSMQRPIRLWRRFWACRHQNGAASWWVKAKQVGFYWHEVCGNNCVIQPRSCITLEDNSNPGSLRQPCMSSRTSFEKRYRYIGITLKEKATIWDWCYLLELSIKRSIRLSTRIPIFFSSIRFFDTSSAELISIFVPLHTSECRNEVLLSKTSR